MAAVALMESDEAILEVILFRDLIKARIPLSSRMIRMMINRAKLTCQAVRRHHVLGFSLVLVSLLIPILLLACKGSASRTPTASSTPTGAREFAVLLATKAGEGVTKSGGGDWETIRSLLVPEFQGYREDALHRAMNSGFSLTETVMHSFSDPNQWQEERHPEFTIVRVIKFPTMALVLRQGSGGEWRLDPGPYALALAEAYQQAEPLQREHLLAIIPRNVRGGIQTNPDQHFQVVRRFGHEIIDINLKGENVEVSWVVTFHSASEARVPLAGVSWRAGNQSGPARVVWTTAQIKENLLVFPGAGGSGRYLVTFRLEGVPEVPVVELEIKDIVMDSTEAGAGVGRMSFSVAYSFDPKNP